MLPHHPRTARIREYLHRGRIGEVRRVTSAFSFKLPLDPGNIRLHPEMGGGSLLDVGCYCVYGIRWAVGAEPVSAWAQARYEHGVDVEMTGVLQFADGRLASFDCGFVHPHRQWLEIIGTTGVLTMPDAWVPPPRAVFEVRSEEGTPAETVAVEGEDQMQHMLENFSRYVLEDRPVQPAPDEAAKTLCVLDALARSARSGRPEDIRVASGGRG